MAQDLITQLEAKLESFTSHIDRRFDAMQGHMDERFEQMQGQMDERFEQMQGQMDERFGHMDERFEQMQGQMDKRFEATQEQIRHTTVLVEETKSRVKAVAEGHSILARKLDLAVAELKVERQLDRGETRSAIRRLRGRVDRLETAG